VNEGAGIIYLINSGLEENKNGTEYDFTSLSHWVTPKVQMSNTFIEDVKKIVALKESGSRLQ
jgi:hypothetical protein